MLDKGPGMEKFMLSKRDRRSAARVPTKSMTVRVVGECQSVYGYMRDISGTGLQVRTFSLCEGMPKPRGEAVRLSFQDPLGEMEVECFAKVMWSASLDDRPDINFQGLRFIDIDREVKKRLEGWVRECLP